MGTHEEGATVKTRHLSRYVCVLAILLLHGCGGGGDQTLTATNSPSGSSNGSSGSGPTSGTSGIEGSGIRTRVAYGRIDTIANGAMSVDKQVWDITHAAISIQGSPGTISDLAVGQLVGVIGQPDGTATEVTYAPTIVGSLQNVSLQPGSSTSAVLFVLNQQVGVTANTQFEAGLSPQSLTVGDRLVISALLDASNGLEAMYVARATATAAAEMTGIAFIQDPSASELDINELSVNYANAILKGFPTNHVASGDLVRVIGGADDGGGAYISSFLATEVDKLEPLPLGAPGDTVAVCGLITRFVSAGNLDVEGIPTTTGPNTLIQPFAEALELGAYVCESGTITSTGGVLAQSISVYAYADYLSGNITAIDAAANTITVLGLTLTLGPATKIQDARADPVNRPRLAITDLAVGDYVRVGVDFTGHATTFLTATAVERTRDLKAALLFGPPTPTDYQFGDFTWLGLQVKVSSSTKFIIFPEFIYIDSPLYQCGTDLSNPCTLSEILTSPNIDILRSAILVESFKGSFDSGVLEATVEVIDPM
jgi:hypothetical protein